MLRQPTLFSRYGSSTQTKQSPMDSAKSKSILAPEREVSHVPGLPATDYSAKVLADSTARPEA